jgi:hypothetical protein
MQEVPARQISFSSHSQQIAVAIPWYVLCPNEMSSISPNEKLDMVELEEILSPFSRGALRLCVLLRREHAWGSLDNSERGHRRQLDQYEWRQCSELSFARKTSAIKQEQSVH